MGILQMPVAKQISKLHFQSMFNKKVIFIINCLLSVCTIQAQDCALLIRGNFFDQESELPLPFVNVFVQETAIGTVIDTNGDFIIDDICEGEYHFIFSHIGCDPIKIHIDLFQDTTLSIRMSHTATSLGDVLIKGKKDNYYNQPNLSVNR